MKEKIEAVSASKGLCARFLFWSSLYFIGVWKKSIYWLILPISANFAWKIRQSIVDRTSQTSDYAQLKQEFSRIRDLPSWVYFPDCERAEWINRLLKGLWPHLREYLSSTLKQSVSQISPTLELSESDLGDIPIRIGGVKVYDNTKFSANEIVMDLDVILASDCRYSVSVKYLPGFLNVGLRDLFLQGTVRVKLKPLLEDMPLIGSIQVAFLQKPMIDFDLGGLANVFDVPGLSRILRNLICEKLEEFAVTPNYIVTPLVDLDQINFIKNVSARYSEFQVLRLKVCSARHLDAKDRNILKENSSDPYVLVKVMGNRTKKSQVINESLNPEWNFCKDYLIAADDSAGAVSFEVWDSDRTTDDDFLGRTSMNINDLRLVFTETPQTELWLPLEGSEDRGEICVRSAIFQLSNDSSCLERLEFKDDYGLMDGTTETPSAAVLQVYVEKCTGLLNKRGRAPNAQLSLYIEDYDVRNTKVYEYAINPDIKTEFDFLSISPWSDKLTIKIVDVDELDDPIGKVKLSLSTLLSRPGSKMKTQPWKLRECRNCPEALVIFKAKLSFLTKKKII